MVWDDPSSGTIKDLQACYKPTEGGIGCSDLNIIANAQAVTVIARTSLAPEKHWVPIVKEVIVSSALGRSPVLMEAVRSPWLQWFGSKHKIPLEIQGIWNRWRKMAAILDAEHNPSGLIRITPPQTSENALNTYIWYHPRIGNSQGAGPKKWGSQVWKLLWREGIRVLGDIWNTWTQQPRVSSNLTSKEDERVRHAIMKVMESLPEPWKSLVGVSCRWRRPEHPREEYLVEGLKEITPEKLTFKRLYQLLIIKKLKGTDFSNRTMGPLEAYRARTGLAAGKKRLGGQGLIANSEGRGPTMAIITRKSTDGDTTDLGWPTVRLDHTTYIGRVLRSKGDLAGGLKDLDRDRTEHRKKNNDPTVTTWTDSIYGPPSNDVSTQWTTTMENPLSDCNLVYMESLSFSLLSAGA